MRSLPCFFRPLAVFLFIAMNSCFHAQSQELFTPESDSAALVVIHQAVVGSSNIHTFSHDMTFEYLCVVTNPVQNATYYGAADGSITITGIDGGSTGYKQVSLNGQIIEDRFEDSLTIDSLSACNYFLLATDDSGCGSDTVRFTITQPSTFTFAAHVAQHETTASAGDGVILIDSIYAGQMHQFEYTTNDQFTWKPVAQGDSISGFGAGTYTIILHSGGVESEPLTLTIDQICNPYAVTIDNLTHCGNTKGSVSANGLDPNKHYEYVLIPKNAAGKPIITLLGDNPVNITVGSSYTDAGASANDPVFGDISNDIVTISTVNTAVVGTYKVRYNVSNPAGLNADEQVRTVIVSPVDTYTLIVANGTGTGQYSQNQVVVITANPPAEGYQFKEWTGDVVYLTDPTASSTALSMPAGAVSVEATYEEKSTPYDPEDFIMEFSITDKSLTIPFFNTTGYDCTIDWGDGSPLSVITAYDDTDRVHTYAENGTYVVKIRGVCRGIYFNNSGDRLKLKKILQWGDVGFTVFNGAFYGCSNLNSLPYGSITGASAVISFYAAFAYCTGLTYIPINIFKDNPNVSFNGFTATFIGCTGLTYIPADLFRYNTNVSTNGFKSTFSDCTGLTSLPVDLFRYNTLVSTNGFAYTFSGCKGLISIPADLFRYNINVSESGFSFTFSSCTGLTSIPEDLFFYNTNCNSYSYTFSHCKNLVLPSRLFNLSALSIVRSFLNFMYTSSASYSHTGAIQDVWNYATSALKTEAFRNCTYISNYADIPNAWK